MLSKLLYIAENAAFEAQLIANNYINDAQVLSSVFKDIKTQADLMMNDQIINCLQSTKIPILSEEKEHDKEIPEQCWIVDPLDGTFNFSRGYPCAGISIALWKNNEPVLGVVRDVFGNTTYSSILGQGALFERSTIRVSETMRVKDAILATGFPSGANYEEKELLPFLKNVQTFKKIRALGAASLMLSHVASGVFDVYYEKDIYLWDVAAGLSLVREAGGEVYYQQKSGTMKYDVLASNKNLFEESKSILVK
jgi:myo-inositol-1(or 4)-monophosphatase